LRTGYGQNTEAGRVQIVILKKLPCCDKVVKPFFKNFPFTFSDHFLAGRENKNVLKYQLDKIENLAPLHSAIGIMGCWNHGKNNLDMKKNIL